MAEPHVLCRWEEGVGSCGGQGVSLGGRQNGYILQGCVVNVRFRAAGKWSGNDASHYCITYQYQSLTGRGMSESDIRFGVTDPIVKGLSRVTGTRIATEESISCSDDRHSHSNTISQTPEAQSICPQMLFLTTLYM